MKARGFLGAGNYEPYTEVRSDHFRKLDPFYPEINELITVLVLRGYVALCNSGDEREKYLEGNFTSGKIK